jgi:hypothetical protein
MDPIEEIVLRTRPLHTPDYPLGADGTRKFPTAATVSVLVPPGTYTVKLISGSVERTAPLVVRKDPNTIGSEDEIAAQTKVMISIRQNANIVARMINAAESVRAQLVAWRAIPRSGPAASDVTAAADALEKDIVELESRLVNLTATGRGQDFLRTPSQLIDKLTHLADVVAYADFAPTESQIQVDAKLSQDIAHEKEQLDGIVARPLAAFNALLRERQLGAIVAPKP